MLDKETKIVIIGFGHLMEYIAPCYERFLSENLEQNLIATTADQKLYPEKKEKCKFQVLLHQNETALKQHPDIILFAPPPQIAPQLTEGLLRPYYSECRRKNQALPDLYVFPPAPAGKYYLQELGEDVRVVNILPNMTKEIAGRDVAEEGYTILTFPVENQWETSKKERLIRFFQPLGKTLELRPQETLPVLASSVSCNVFLDILLLWEELLKEEGQEVSCAAIASAMRSVLYNQWKLEIPGSLEYDRDAAPSEATGAILETIEQWMQGLLCFLERHQVPKQTIRTFLAQRMDSFLQMGQLMTQEDLGDMRRKRATKGGALRSGLCQFETCREECIAALQHIRQGQLVGERLENIAGSIAEAVLSHSTSMADKKPAVRFQIDHHATLYALLSRQAQLRFGEEGKEAMGNATLLYGQERGRRMAAQATENGDPLTLESYFAYVEWTDEDQEMKRGIAQKTPEYRTAVYECGWVKSWKKRGLLQYGQLYCRYADQGLVTGFNPKNRLQLDQVLSFGADHCDFQWTGYALDEKREAILKETRERLGMKYRKDFLYHTAHLYQCIKRELIQTFGDLGREAVEHAMEEFATVFSAEEAKLVQEYRF